MKKPTQKEIDAVTLKMLDYINNTPGLMSLLYDLNMLPEQLKENKRDWWKMMRIAEAWMKQFGKSKP